MAIKTRVGIIPAAGAATRYGGVLKELLPVDSEMVMMDYAVNAMKNSGCDQIVCVTSTRKIAQIADRFPHLLYTIQTVGQDIWGAIRAAISVEADEYCFAMPDTVLPENCFDIYMSDADFYLGCFDTNLSERFGMIRDGYIVNKHPGADGQAWGVLMWTKRIRDWWINYGDVTSYTNAFNLAMKTFGYKTFDLEYYHDIASFEDYRTLLCR